MLFHRKSCFLCRERSRRTGFIAFIKIIAAGDAPLGQRQEGVFRVPPPCLWTPPTPQRERGCSPLSDPKAVGLHTKNPSRFARGFFVFRRFRVACATRCADKLVHFLLRECSRRESAAVDAVYHYDLPCEKANQENPQIFLVCQI